MAKNYIDKYGLDAIKRHLRRGTRYFKICGDYANIGVILFDNNLLAFDLGVRPADFPVVIQEQNGWRLPRPPTDAEIDAFLTSRTKTA